MAYYEPEFAHRDDHGTTHLSVVDSAGSAVALTTTVNLIFGSRVMDSKTGIIFNDGKESCGRLVGILAENMSRTRRFRHPGRSGRFWPLSLAIQLPRTQQRWHVWQTTAFVYQSSHHR